MPNDTLVTRGYALRVGICTLVDDGKITLPQGVELFGIEKKRMIMEKAAQEARRKSPRPVPLEDLEPSG